VCCSGFSLFAKGWPSVRWRGRCVGGRKLRSDKRALVQRRPDLTRSRISSGCDKLSCQLSSGCHQAVMIGMDGGPFRGDAGVDYGARLWPAFCIAMSG
jgi:hypothetical protein